MPLTLSEQLDAMLAGWLDRHAPEGDDGRIARAVLTVATSATPELEALCARRGMTARRTGRPDARWAVLVIEGPALTVRGLTEITGMYRR